MLTENPNSDIIDNVLLMAVIRFISYFLTILLKGAGLL